jgi:hypothetical protein
MGEPLPVRGIKTRLRILAALACCAAGLLVTTGPMDLAAASPGQAGAVTAKKHRHKKKHRRKHKKPAAGPCEGAVQAQQCAKVNWTNILGGRSFFRTVGNPPPPGPYYSVRTDLCRNGTWVETTNGTQTGYMNWTNTARGTWSVFSASTAAAGVNIFPSSYNSVYSDGSPGPGNPGPNFYSGYAMTIRMTPAGEFTRDDVLWPSAPGPC